MKKSKLNTYLKEMTRLELEGEIKKLYSKFNEVKQFYELELSEDTSAILNKFKDKIEKEYFPTRGYGKGRSKESRKVITDFKKISVFNKDVVELLLCRVENMIGYASYGDMNDAFYNSLISSFNEACQLISSERLENEYLVKCRKLVDETGDLGYGVTESFEDLYWRYFGESHEEEYENKNNTIQK